METYRTSYSLKYLIIMSINWKRPKEVRYEQSIQRLAPLFYFIFTYLKKSNIKFDLYKPGIVGVRSIKKTYDVCLLVSLYILKLVANLNTSATSSDWKTSDECTDTELLMIWYFAFNKDYPDPRIIWTIGEDERRKIKVPDICEWFYDDTKIDKIKWNNFNKYMRSIPREKIWECIWHLWYILDRSWWSRVKIREKFDTFFKEFINGMDNVIPRHSMSERYKDNFSYYFNLCGGKYNMFWLSLCAKLPDEVEARMYEVQKKKTKKQKSWTDFKH